MLDLEFEQSAHHTLYLLDTWIAEFNHFSAINTDDMIVLFVAVRFLKLRHIFAKLVFGHQVA